MRARGVIAVALFVALLHWLPYPEFIEDVFPLSVLWLQIPCLIAFLICTRLKKEAPHPWYAVVKARLHPTWTAIIVVLLAIGWPIAMLGILGVIGLDLPADWQPEGPGWLNWRFLLYACLIAPVFEELFFREGLFRVIRNPVVYFVVSTVLFAWFHTYSFQLDLENMNYAVWGAILGAGRMLGVSLWGVMIVHAVMNLTISVVLFILLC